MATVEIDVELNGLGKASKDLKKVENQMVDLDEAGSAVGESFANAGGAIATMGDTASEALGPAIGSIGGLVGSMGELKDAAASGGGSFMSLLGPIGMVALAVFEATSAFREWSNEVDGTTMKLESYQAAAAEAKGVIEGLSDVGVKLTSKEIELIQSQTIKAQVPLEAAQKLVEKTATIRLKVDEQTRLIKESVEVLKDSTQIPIFEEIARGRIAAAEKKLAKNREELSRINKEATALYIEGAKERQKSAKMRMDFEERSIDKLKEKAQLLLDIENEVISLRTGRLYGDEEAQLLAIRIESSKRLSELHELVKKGTLESSKFSELETEIVKKAQQDQIKITKEAEKTRRADRKANYDKRKADRLKLASELHNIRLLEIQLMEDELKKQEALIKENYNFRKLMAVDNSNVLRAVDLQYSIDYLNLQKKTAQELDKQDQIEEQKRATARQNEIRLLNEADQRQIARIGMMEQGIDSEIALLETRYQLELRMAEDNAEQITLINEKYLHDFENIQKQTQISLGDFMPTIETFGKGLAQSTAAALLFGESFKDSVANVLKSLSMEAGVKALMETAYGTAALIFQPALAAKHFQSAAIFAGASVAARIGSSALGGGGGGGGMGGGGGGGVSPSQAPPLREEADSSRSIVYNINFGGTVYDTKKAARIALSDEVTRQQLRRRRGAPNGV